MQIQIYDTQIKSDTHTFLNGWENVFSVLMRQDSGTVQARPNQILEFPSGRNLFISHKPLNTGMGWAGP